MSEAVNVSNFWDGYDAVPHALRERDQWVAWERRAGRKVPLDPKIGANASSTDPTTWGTFEQAVRAAAERGLSGVGFVPTKDDDLYFWDVDGCADRDTGEIEPDALEFAHATGSYAEFSPSGKGLRGFCRGPLPEGTRSATVRASGRRIEVYGSGQYATVTGDHLPGTPEEVREVDPAAILDFSAPAGTAGGVGRLGPIAETLPEGSRHNELFRVGSTMRSAGVEDREAVAAVLSAVNERRCRPPKTAPEIREEVSKVMEARLGVEPAEPEPRKVASKLRIKGLVAGEIAPGLVAAFELPEEEANSIAERAEKIYDVSGGEVRIKNKFAGKPSEGPSVPPSVPDHTADYRPDRIPPVSSGALPPVPDFPVDSLPPVLRRLVVEGAEDMKVPPEFIANPALASVASAAGASRALQIKRTWREFPSLWIATVAYPSDRKTPPWRLATAPAWKEQTRLKQENDVEKQRYEQQLEAYEASKRAKKGDAPKPGKEPTLRDVVVQDTTVEALADAMDRNRRGILVGHNELSAFFSGMNEYKAGGADRARYMNIWDSAPLKVNRKSGVLYVERPVLNVAGNITPDLLQKITIPEGDDGMAHRFLYSFPDRMKVLDDLGEDEIPAATENRFQWLYERLKGLEPNADGEPVVLRLTPDAYETFRQEKINLNAERFAPGFPPNLDYAWGKMPGHLARLSLVLGLVRIVTEGGEESITGEDIGRAVALIDYYRLHTRRVHALLFGESNDQRWLRIINGLLDEQGGDRWRVGSGNLRDLMVERGAYDVPERPEDLTRDLLTLAGNTPGMTIEKAGSRINGQRGVDISRVPLEASPAVPPGVSRTVHTPAVYAGTVGGGISRDTLRDTSGPEKPEKVSDLILWTLGRAGEKGMFRKDIADATGIPLKTVKNNVTTLLAERRVAETGEPEGQTRRVRLPAKYQLDTSNETRR